MRSEIPPRNWSGLCFQMLMVLGVGWLVACGGEMPATVSTRPQGLGSTNKVLILGASVTGGSNSVEAVAARSLGYTVEVVSDAAWAAKSSADFAGYRAIILGDATCAGSLGVISAASKSRGVWGPVVDGNVIIMGTDPVYHYKEQVTKNAVQFAAARRQQQRPECCYSWCSQAPPGSGLEKRR